jgi:hypothetical protein
MTTSPPRFADHEFRKAARSEPKKNCVRVARRDGWVEMRDDKLLGTPAYEVRALRFTEEEFDAYLASIRADGQEASSVLESARRDGRYVFWRADSASVELEFTEDEVIAFHHGVVNREFDACAFAAA